ncbi:MAG: aminotransferase class I/II-fold pyridoxal phosphate-dependent enzyme, partial [Planctomycetes bacterium]|nr:aminotransferase class I/II-fold pyridoxal phosphate-dependent enzyme [Planctomycetota bacterium]
VFNGVNYDPETELCVTVGSSGAFASAVFATLDPGDEVVLIEPFYGYHLNTLLLAGIRPRYARMSLKTMTLDRASIEQAISLRTKGIVVCTPGNPSGMVYGRDDLAWLGELAAHHDLLLYTDEIYEYIVYDGRAHISAASLPGLRERTVTIGGYSKTFSITGWRIGYLAAPADILARAAVCSDLLYVCAPHPLQRGVLAGLSSPPEYYAQMCRDYQKARDSICDALEAARFAVYRPQGSYYVIADFSALGWPDDQTASAELLKRARIAAIPGGAFYEPGSGRGRNQLRFCFAKEPDVLAEACRRLRAL